jgi:hypothetical protein
MYYDDTNGSANCSAYFTVYDLYGDIVDEWGVNSTGSGGEAYRDTSEFTHTVNYGLYSYVLHWRPNDLGSDVQLCGFRIFYHSPSSATFLPTVFRNHQ